MPFVETKIMEKEVLISGGGPTGLLIGYGLQRMGISTCIIERHIKSQMPMYGRACTLYPGSLEILDRYQLLDKFSQVGFIGRSARTYKDGLRVVERDFQFMFDQMDGTFLDYILNIRMKYSEELIQEEYEKLGGKVLAGWELSDLSITDGAKDGLRVEILIKELASGHEKRLKGKYLIGADGARSKTRTLAGIASDVDDTTMRWVRIDGEIETDLPEPSVAFGFIESSAHGNVLWVNLDHGRSRIGYSVTDELYAKYGDDMSQEEAMKEAIASMAPFKVEFKSVDWYTLYRIKQSVAQQYIKDYCIILAGDACHLHSSGAAQGMNTGMHDAVNLTWKLAGVLKGWWKPKVLESYETERRGAAQHLIELDKAFSSLLTGNIPEKYRHVSDDPNEAYRILFEESTPFNLGLGIHYSAGLCNAGYIKEGHVLPGRRALDALVYGPGSKLPSRILQLTPNTGVFWVMVFAGEPLLSSVKVKAFKQFLDSDASFTKKYNSTAIRFMTIISGVKSLACTALGFQPFGRTFYDPDNSAHIKYGLAIENGGLVVVRPDGVLGCAASLNDGNALSAYFARFMQPI